ncbi:Os03g0220200, partial [Oryza sativa Japonica Group]
MHLRHVAGEVEGDEAGAAAHAGQVEAADVAAELVLVDDHGGERRCRGEETAVDDEDVDVLGLESGAADEVVDGGEDYELGLGARRLHGRVRRDVVVGRREAGLLPEPRPLEDPGLEPHALLVVGDEARVLHERGERHPAAGRRLVAGVVDEVHRPWPRHEVHRADEHDEEHRAEDVDEVELQRPPQRQQLTGPHPRQLQRRRRHHRHQQQRQEVVHQILVPQLHVLQLHRPGVPRRPRHDRCSHYFPARR